MSIHARFSTLCLLALSYSPANALEIRVYNSATHDRFLNFPSAPTHNPNFLHTVLDLTGAGWWFHGSTGQRRGITMVSPIHYVGASHSMPPGPGATVSFLSSDNIVKNYTIASQVAITNDDDENSDLFIGRLNATIPIADNVGFHPYLNLANEFAYTSMAVALLGVNAQAGSETISDIANAPPVNGLNETRVLRLVYSTQAGNNDEAYYTNGDSGSPVFVNQNGVAAIVGTNSFLTGIAIGGNITYSSYANFVPYYVDKLNLIMEPDGYRMTKAIPGNSALALTHTPPVAIIRAGYSFSIDLNLDNTGGTMAENVKLENSFPAGTNIASASGTQWFDESIAPTTNARRAKLNSGSNTDYRLTLSIPSAGMHTHSVTYRSDQSAAVTENFTLNVIESFVSWSAALTDQTAMGDDDLDGVTNLLEYAFGGDPTQPSRQVSGETTQLLPEISQTGATQTFSYVRRKDYLERALTYSLRSSTTLQSGSFTDASSFIDNTSTSSINDDLELVTLALTGTGTERFFRIEVELNE